MSAYKYRIKIHGWDKPAIMRELIDEFLQPEEYDLLPDDGFYYDRALHINASGSTDRDTIKAELFDRLKELTGKRPDWGILTGVRPVKLAGEMLESTGNRDQVLETFTGPYRLTDEKSNLIVETYERQKSIFGKPHPDSVGIYIGIPFCPTRCVYCSFASNQVPDSEIERYMPALLHEIEVSGSRMKESGLFAESIYIGGGTPTTLSEDQLEALLRKTIECLDAAHAAEFTVEAGRPDTITPGKLSLLKQMGVSRISINPQSMQQKTLDAIGRFHTPEDIEKAFQEAQRVGFPVINADLIAGLPGEDEEDFRDTLTKVLALGANNITVHTLAVKRASRLKDIDESYHYKAAETVAKMLSYSREILSGKGFSPYYLYRQKHMAGYFENTGWALPGTENLYNVRIMDEHQTIVALGAGGISKRYYPETNRLERVPNVTNYREYIDRIEEMLIRKDNKLWR